MNANMYRCLFLDGKADQFPQRDECKENNVLYFVRFERIFFVGGFRVTEKAWRFSSKSSQGFYQRFV